MFVTFVRSLQLFFHRCELTVDSSVCGAGKDRWGYPIEWVEKAFFALLNKLFEIEVSEQNHKVLLLDKNLLALINEPKLFVMPVFHRMAPSFLVLDKHFMLKNLSFYAVARLADSEARQAHLDKREKNHQEGMLRKTPATSHPASSSTVWPPAKKKERTCYSVHPEDKDSAICTSTFSISFIILSVFIFFNY